MAILVGLTIISLPSNLLASLPWLYPSGITITIGSVTVLLVLPKVAPLLTFLISIPRIKRLLPGPVINKINELLAQFAEGTKCLTNPVIYPVIAISTAAIWLCYWLNFYFVLLAFSLGKSLTLGKGLTLFTVSSLGSLVPTPGCVGGFHFLVSKALTLTCQVDQNLALAFATVLHAFAFVITICLAALFCLAWQEFAENKFGTTDKNALSDR
jgi:hypothetical protein